MNSKRLVYLLPAGLLVLFLLTYVLMAFLKPVPLLAAAPVVLKSNTNSPDFANHWPLTGEGAVGAIGYGVLAASNNQTPQPTASVAKVMNALLILKQHPLQVGEQGPELTMTSNDLDLYNSYVAKDGSVARVTPGEKITEYQLLQAMLLPSAD